MTQEAERHAQRSPDLVDVADEAAAASAREKANKKPVADQESSTKPKTKRSGPGSRLLRALPMVIFLVVLVLVVPAFVARVYAIPSGSMETTLHGCTGCTNDRVLVDKVSYRFTTPKPGDVVVFVRPSSWHNSELEQTPEPTSGLGRTMQSLGNLLGLQEAGQTDLIKRVIAVGGQTVSCCDSRNRLEINGKPLDEPYVYYAPGFGPAQQAAFGPVKVPDGDIWAMGDSRNNSVDSRAIGDGPVPLANVIGRARLIVYPFARFGRLNTGTSQPSATQ